MFNPLPSFSSDVRITKLGYTFEEERRNLNKSSFFFFVCFLWYSNPRASRNMAEKQRRDNLNTNISAMAALVPTVAESPRKMDKISILRLAANFLRIHYSMRFNYYTFIRSMRREMNLQSKDSVMKLFLI